MAKAIDFSGLPHKPAYLPATKLLLRVTATVLLIIFIGSIIDMLGYFDVLDSAAGMLQIIFFPVLVFFLFTRYRGRVARQDAAMERFAKANGWDFQATVPVDSLGIPEEALKTAPDRGEARFVIRGTHNTQPFTLILLEGDKKISDVRLKIFAYQTILIVSKGARLADELPEKTGIYNLGEQTMVSMYWNASFDGYLQQLFRVAGLN